MVLSGHIFFIYNLPEKKTDKIMSQGFLLGGLFRFRNPEFVTAMAVSSVLDFY